MTLAQILAKNITHYRELRGFTQEQLGRAAGKSRATINRIESGDSGTTLDTLARIAAILQVDESLLIASGEPPKPILQELTPAEMLLRLGEIVKEHALEHAILQGLQRDGLIDPADPEFQKKYLGPGVRARSHAQETLEKPSWAAAEPAPASPFADIIGALPAANETELRQIRALLHLSPDTAHHSKCAKEN